MAEKKKKKAEPQGKSLNIDNALRNRPRNRIARCGVELEGGWAKLPEGARLEADTSVFRNNVPYGMQCGEIPIGPMQVGYMPRAVTKYYPSKVDHTCGMHVHMGFETVYQYNLLADSPDYQETVIDYMSRWAKEEGLPETHPIWSRLRGESAYCQKKFWPMEQIQITRKDHDREREGHRYTMIHYCWGRYQTVECRLLPMMATAELGIRAIRRLIDVTNAYLLTVDKKRVKENGKVELDNGDIYEEYITAKL